MKKYKKPKQIGRSTTLDVYEIIQETKLTMKEIT